MCVRLHPDVVVATEVNNAIKSIALRRGLSYSDILDEDSLSNISGDLSYIYVSVDSCLERQINYTKIGLCNVFIGYGDECWTQSDYRDYFEKQHKHFDLVDKHIWLYRYKPNRDESLIGLTVSAFAGHIAKRLLTQETYNATDLSVLGIQ